MSADTLPWPSGSLVWNSIAKWEMARRQRKSIALVAGKKCKYIRYALDLYTEPNIALHRQILYLRCGSFEMRVHLSGHQHLQMTSGGSSNGCISTRQHGRWEPRRCSCSPPQHVIHSVIRLFHHWHWSQAGLGLSNISIRIYQYRPRTRHIEGKGPDHPATIARPRSQVAASILASTVKGRLSTVYSCAPSCMHNGAFELCASVASTLFKGDVHAEVEFRTYISKFPVLDVTLIPLHSDGNHEKWGKREIASRM